VCVRVLYPEYRGSPITTHKSKYDRFSPMANGWGTIHLIPYMTHHSWLKRRSHQLKRN
jgi:hypothetical protein